MLKLYKEIEDELHYWETWESGKNAGVVHKGIVGDRGKDKEVTKNYREMIDKEIERLVKDGYDAIEVEDHDILVIEFAIEGNGTKEDLVKRSRLEDRLDNAMGWSGLGHCDEGTQGNGTMEVYCVVVDYELAKPLIETDLKKTEFKDFARIYKKE